MRVGYVGFNITQLSVSIMMKLLYYFLWMHEKPNNLHFLPKYGFSAVFAIKGIPCQET